MGLVYQLKVVAVVSLMETSLTPSDTWRLLILAVAENLGDRISLASLVVIHLHNVRSWASKVFRTSKW